MARPRKCPIELLDRDVRLVLESKRRSPRWGATSESIRIGSVSASARTSEPGPFLGCMPRVESVHRRSISLRGARPPSEARKSSSSHSMIEVHSKAPAMLEVMQSGGWTFPYALLAPVQLVRGALRRRTPMREAFGDVGLAAAVRRDTMRLS